MSKKFTMSVVDKVELGLDKKIKPLYDYLYITANSVKESTTAAGIIIPETAQESIFLPNQTVVAKGPAADQVEVGDEVMINQANFLRAYKNTRADQNVDETMRVKLPIEEIDGVKYMRIMQRDIKYKILKQE